MDDRIGIKQLNKARQVNVTVEHDITQRGSNTYGWVGYCETHRCTALNTRPTPEDAREHFICDGTGARFLVEFTDPPGLYLHDLSGLRSIVRNLAYAASTGYDGVTERKVWQWIGDGRTAPVTIRQADHGDAWIAVDADGAELVRF